MAKQLNQVSVNLQFTADTKQAKQQLEGLQQTLNNLVRNPSGNLDKQMAAAAKSAAELSSHLAKATNRTTGTLDFSKLNQSIQKSGKSISEYGAELLKLGPVGHQAFSQLTTAITNSEIPMRRMSKTLQEMGTVLSNTIRWQISSSAIHAVQGALQGAYRYAQNLNKSLNDIRIVTGQSAEQMEKFAERANRAAKNLSSTTLDYTNASLIYYQQGLSDEEVEARTNVTIKMANAAGESAEKVSSQLTAVWNNFAKGGENLEYYADVMTALGAATASSTDEISQGLEKFASVADTVGLSYEYAAAALATVTATTRQSADVVGNAFKTLFARLEGLKLGETLDDGTDLNKYSQALNAVGVSIKDTDGELRNMDNILDDLAGKWQNLSKDQKMALAQTVAGVRQYAQLIALMDNWDFMERNIETARKSSGTLQRQADIYAESWEAAQKRVQTALQGVYNALIKDDFFITILNGTEKVITGVNNVIKAFGGLPGVLSTLGVVFTRVFEKQIAQGLQNTVYNIKMMLPGGKAELVQTREAELTKLADLTATQNYDTDQDLKRAQALDTQINLHKELIQNASKLNEIEFSTTLQLLDQVEAQRQNLDAALQRQEKAIGSIDTIKENKFINPEILKDVEEIEKKYTALSEITQLSSQQDLTKAEAQQKLQKIAQDYNITLSGQTNSIAAVTGALESEIETLEQQLIIGDDSTKEGRQQIQVLKQLVAALQEKARADQGVIKANKNMATSAEQVRKAYEAQRLIQRSWADNVVFAAQSLSQLSMGFNSLKGVLNSLNDDNLSFFEKLSSIIPALGFGLPQLINGFLGAGSTLKSIGLKFPELIKQYHSLIAVQKTKQVLDKIDIDLSKANRIQQDANILSLNKNNAAKLKNILTKQLDLSVEEQSILETELSTLARQNHKKATEGQIRAIVQKIMAQRAENVEETASIGLKQKAIALNQVFHLQYIALAIAIAAVVFIIYKLIQARKADAEQAERAAQLASSLKENYEKAKTAAEELRKTISDYKDGIKSLNQLDKATDEYKETLKKTNEEARKLIETVGAYGDWHYDSNGAIIVDNLDKYQQQADQRVTSIQQSYQAAQIESVKANLAAQATSTVRGLGLNTGDLNRQQDLSSIIGIYQDWKSESANGSANNLDLIRNINEYLESQGKAAFAVDDSVFERIESKLSNFTEAIDNANSKIRYFSQELEKTKIEENFGDRIKESLLSSDNEVYASVMNVLANELITENKTADWSSYKGINSLTLDQLKFFGLSMPLDSTVRKPTEEYLRAYIENVLKQDLSGYTYKDGKFIDIAGNELSGVNTDNLDMKMIIQGLAYAYDQMTNKPEYTEKNKQTVNGELSFTNRLIENFGSDYAKLINNFRASPNESLSGLSSFNHYSEYIDAQKFIDDFIAGKDSWEDAGFKNADIFIEAFQKELSNVDWKAFNTTKNNEGIETAKALGLDEKEFVIYRNLLQEQSKILQGLSDEDYAKYVEGINAASIANKRLERGVTDICKKWKDYNAIMKDSNAAIEDVSRVLADVNPAVQDMLNLSAKEFALLPPDFAQKHWDLITQVTDGVEGAADKLRDIAGKEILLKIAGDDTEFQNVFSDLHNYIADLDKENFKIGIPLELQNQQEISEHFINLCNQLLANGKITADQMQAYAKSMGYDVEIAYGWHDSTITVPKYSIKGVKNLDQSIFDAEMETASRGGASYEVEIEQIPVKMRDPIPSVKVITPNGSYGGNSLVNTSGVAGSKKTGSSGGGKGGSSSKKETKTVERYKTITDQIDKIKDSYSDVNKEADRLFGPKRWAEIEKSNKLLEKQNDLLEEKKKEAEDYFDQDQAALMGAAAAAGITFEFDANGIITNYREQMEAYYARYNSSEQTDEQKKILKKLEEALKQYEDTRKVLQDIQNEIDDNTRAIQDANNKILTERFNLKVEIRADQLKYIENQIKALGDDFFKRSEIFMLMANKLASYDGSNMTIDRSWYDQLIGQFNNIQNANISDADWLNNMKALKNEAQSAFDALIDWSKGMSTYYAETLSEFASGLDFFTKQLDHLNDTIDHYRKTASLVGRDKDFQLLAKISEATLHNAIQQKEVKEAELALLEKQKDTVLNTYNGPWSSEEDRNAYFQAAVKPILEQYQTVEKEVQALDEKILEANNQWAENKKNQALEIAEMALTAGKGFDQLNKSMDLASKTQDLLLTKTNQYYEIDKLINNINKDIDKTDNLAAKQRYKNLADEISGLREKNQLSQFELKVAQAKYAQLQAQIALEEVQNAKSTVRLQRDNEGNYGYVYTADISQIEDAEQELRDKTNDLYNLYLEGANTTAQELLKLQQEFQDDLANIDWTAADAMQQAMELRKRYLEEVEILLSDHNIATTGLAELGAQGIQEAWTTEFFDPNIESLENWKDVTDQEIEEITQVYQDWEDVIKDNTDVLDSLDNIDKELEVVKEEAERLNEQGQDYIDKSKSIIDAIQDETTAWAKQYTQIQNLVQEYLNLAKAIDDTIDAKRREAIEEAKRQQEEAKQITPVAPATTNTNNNNGNNSGNTGSNGTTQRVQKDIDTPLSSPKSSAIGGNWSGIGENGDQEAPTPHKLSRSYDRSGYTIYAYGLDDNHIAYYKIQGVNKTFYSLFDAYAHIDNLQNNKAGYIQGVYDTGGYTGSWGSDGRLAMLHEKELVLNKDDTKNFLAGVEILRSITGAIDLQAAAAGTATPISTPGFNLGGQTLQQSVTISAEFPNATNHSEIEEAFNNLINRASQYAHRQSFYNQI